MCLYFKGLKPHHFSQLSILWFCPPMEEYTIPHGLLIAAALLSCAGWASAALRCSNCGRTPVPYPLSTAPNCGDPTSSGALWACCGSMHSTGRPMKSRPSAPRPNGSWSDQQTSPRARAWHLTSAARESNWIVIFRSTSQAATQFC